MKKQFSVLTIGAMLIGLAISSFGTALISDAAPANDKNQNSRGEALKPIPAANIKIAKKIPASLAIKETKGKPSSPGEDKNKGKGAATGFLGTEAAGDKYAVVIGICDYPEDKDGIQEIQDICDSDGDSYYMVKALIENYGY
ncbi:MAG: hypothetical protein KAS87_06895, partial [Candidatus Omnitrophica bacterium]|nr:hypothetical protein [Candidatus Omnitrophota bacterium]